LKANVDDAELAWVQQGFKNEVEQAQQVKANFEANAPQYIWNAWVSAYNPDVDLMTDPNQQAFAPTSIIPANPFDEQWMTFRLDSTEMAQLIQKAPQELKNIFGDAAPQEDIEEISFEYRSVALTRHWFHPELLQARFWRLPDGAPLLSDGGSPAKGTMPAYVAALVLVRNIQVRTSATPKRNTQPRQGSPEQ
jgi:hypothetical protein